MKGRGDNKGSSGGMKTDGRRVSRVEKEVQAIISTYIIRHLQSELPGLVTIGRVQIPADLRVARVYVSLLNINNSDQKLHIKDLDDAIDTLQSHAVDIQNEISDKLKMKYLPKLTFFPDESTEKILKIEKILSTIGQNGDVQIDEEDEE